MTIIKIPVEILKVKDPDNIERYRAIISFNNALEKSVSAQNLIGLQNRYATFIQDCKKRIDKINSSRKNRSSSKIQWELADNIFSFVKKMESDDYIFANFIDSITRDLDLSKTHVNKLIKFRTNYPTLESVSDKINWSKYRELLEISNSTIRKRCEEKIISGEIKTERQIREFKKSSKTINHK